jgi:hypothetical protein
MKRTATRAQQQPRLRRRRTVARRHLTLHAHRRQFASEVAAATPRGSTLLALVQEVQQRVANDADVVRIIRWLVNSGTVVLTGSFAGRHF